jgi:hypothetical protein
MQRGRAVGLAGTGGSALLRMNARRDDGRHQQHERH